MERGNPVTTARSRRTPRRSVEASEAPYPLLRNFLTLILPIVAALLVALVIAAASALTTIVERAFQADATRRHAHILATLATDAPDALAQLSRGEPLNLTDTVRVRGLLGEEAARLDLSCISLAAPDGSVLLVNGVACPNPTPDQVARLRDQIERQLSTPGASIFRQIREPIPAWLVASVPQADNDFPVIVATFQDAGPQQGVISTTTIAWVGGLAAALLLATGAAVVLIVRAQREIDRRTAALNSTRDALARFVSNHVRANVLAEAPARRSESTVLFMDIRDFSSFADGATPEQAAALVRKVAEIGFNAVLSQGGDVDRLLGDDLVARFDGPARCDNAYAATEEILTAIRNAKTPRAVGIGLIDGVVVEAIIAADDRADATILGRTVNLGARLCSAAGPGEVVAAAAMPRPVRGRLVEIGVETLALKGHRSPLDARRYALRVSDRV